MGAAQKMPEQQAQIADGRVTVDAANIKFSFGQMCALFVFMLTLFGTALSSIVWLNSQLHGIDSRLRSIEQKLDAALTAAPKAP